LRRILVPLACLTLVVAGCGGPRVVGVDVSAGSASLAVGETLRINFGAVNPSIGDSWYLTGAPDPAVLTDSDWTMDSDCHQAGCGGQLSWTFRASGPGSTTVTFQYCYRSRPENCQPQPHRGPNDPVSLGVTVRG
jgi:predicted secreted protein